MKFLKFSLLSNKVPKYLQLLFTLIFCPKAISFTVGAFRNPIDSHFSVTTVTSVRLNHNFFLWISSVISFFEFFIHHPHKVSSAKILTLLFLEVDGKSYIFKKKQEGRQI